MARLLGVLLVACTLAALSAAPAAAAAAATDPGQLIQSVASTITDIAKTQRGLDRDAAMLKALRRDFDLPYMISIALGQHWFEASDAQKARILAAVERTEAHAYGERLGSFPGATVRVGTAAQRVPGVWMVDSYLVLPGGSSVKVEWEVHSSAEGLRVADVRVEGVSQFLARRTDFQSYIRSHGGTVEPLVQVLEARAAR
jgi:ABC-type transporter MlaC component